MKPQGGTAAMMVDGCLAGLVAKGLRIDTGADRTVVRKDYVPEIAFTGNYINLDSWRGAQHSQHKLARINIKVGSVEALCEVAVADKLDCPALLGADLGKELTVALMTHIISQNAPDSLVPVEAELLAPVQAELSAPVQAEPLALMKEEPLAPVVVDSSRTQPEVIGGSEPTVELAMAPVRGTRAKTVSEQRRVEEDDSASAKSECRPRELSGILDFPDSYFEEDPETTPVAALCTWPAVEQVNIPLPHVAGSVADKGKLVAEQQSDKSLEHVLCLARKGERGYGFEDQILVHYSCDSLGDTNQRVVVPCTRRQQVLKLAHSNLHAGHFRFKKTFARISTHFLWPRMCGEVKQFVRSCAGCQRAARNSNSRAPLMPLPCVAEPFEKVTFDLVGPLPRTSSGNRYILTKMCLYTKYPEAIPLRRVDNQTVLEAMLEIFARHGLPKTILTYQGMVFMSKLTKQLCVTCVSGPPLIIHNRMGLWKGGMLALRG